MPYPNNSEPELLRYTTAGGIEVEREAVEIVGTTAIEELIDQLDSQRGVLLSSGYDYPGRYTRWDIGFCNPPLAVTAKGREFVIEALNERGMLLLAPLAALLQGQPWLQSLEERAGQLAGQVKEPERAFTEEERSKQPTSFSLLRALVACFAHESDAHLGLYGAFGYDLAFQFEPIQLRHQRPADQRDFVLYLPDELIIVDHQKERAARFRYELGHQGRSTRGLPRAGSSEAYRPARDTARRCDHEPGQYAAAVQEAKVAFKCGDLFEVVLSQTFVEPCSNPP
jgi:anthranilate synthase